MAGFEKKDNYWLVQSHVKPSEKLQHMIWPWLDTHIKPLLKNCRHKHITVVVTTDYWYLLRIVILQDTAAMFALSVQEDDPRLQHKIFEMEVFKTEEFKAFVEEMKQNLESIEEDDDPNMRHVERALPGKCLFCLLSSSSLPSHFFFLNFF